MFSNSNAPVSVGRKESNHKELFLKRQILEPLDRVAGSMVIIGFVIVALVFCEDWRECLLDPPEV